MGHRFEAVPDSSVRKVGKDEKKEKTKMRTSAYSEERFDEQDDPQGNEIFELVMLLDKSEDSQALKSLLLSVINADRCEELIPFLKERSTDVNRLKKKQHKSNTDERPRRQSVRRSSKIGRSELLEQGTGTGQRRSPRTRFVEQGSRTNAQSVSTRLNNLPLSPGTSLRRSRQSDSCLRKSHRDSVMGSPNQKARLASSSSLLQLRTTRRSDINRRRNMINLNQGEAQADKANASWDPVPGALTNNKYRSNMGDVLKSPPFSPGNNNLNWDSALSPKAIAGIDKSQNKSSGRMFNESFNLGDNKNDLSDYIDDEDEKSFQETNGSKLLNSFAQFEPTGQVAYREQTVRLHDLVDDIRSNKDSNREVKREDISSNADANDDTISQKKGLRKYLPRQLTKKIISRDKQSVAAESSNENYRSFCDEDKFVIKELNDSNTQNSLQSSIAS